MAETTQLSPVHNRWYYLLLGMGIVVHATGLFSDVMEPDGALYAAIARRMAESGDWINLYGDGADWLDKPHFPFWMTAISFSLLGSTAFAYKLPAFCFWLLGAVYTYRFANTLYNRTIAQWATLFYVFSFHLILSNFDVRAEPYLVGLVAAGIYHLYHLQSAFRLKHLLLASLFMACAVMTKGIFLLVSIGSGFVVQWIILRQWQQFTRWVWYAMVVLVLVGISPELYALYEQFDRHPEKWVFGRQGVSGIRFFFWDSQFGRFFNTGPIQGKGNLFFYLHTILWAFLPWAFLLFAALYWWIRGAIRNRQAFPEYISIGTGLVTLLLFSLSKFQLPHYLNIVFPYYAIVVAYYLYRLQNETTLRRIWFVQQGLTVLVWLGMTGLILVYQPQGWPVCLALLIITGVAVAWRFRRGGLSATLIRNAIMIGVLGLVLNLFFFPDLLRYQSGMQAGRWLKGRGYDHSIVMAGCHSYSLEFYGRSDAKPVRMSALPAVLAQKDTVLVFTPQDSVPALPQGAAVEVLQHFIHFPVSRLDLAFLRTDTRSKRLRKYVLLRVVGRGRDN
jgi:4-amino-4-deoxy-L-arabinose transferase-like glycosyltransferase